MSTPPNDVANSSSPLLQERHVYKPFLYPWCYEAWLTQQRIHWIPEEVPLAEDVRKKDRKLGYTQRAGAKLAEWMKQAEGVAA